VRNGAISVQARLFAAVSELDATPAPSSEVAAGRLIAYMAGALVPSDLAGMCLGEGVSVSNLPYVVDGRQITVLPQWSSTARGHEHPVTGFHDSAGLIITGRPTDVSGLRPSPPTWDGGHLWRPFGAEHMVAAMLDFPVEGCYLAVHRSAHGFSDEEIRLMEQLRAVASRLLRRAAVSSLAVASTSTWGLTPREAEVFAFAGVGLPLSSIAAILGLSVGTVRTYLGKAYAKAAVRSRAAATSALLDVEPTALGEARSRFVPGEAGPLTRREIAVLRVAATGRTTSAIASLIGISGETVKTHLANAYRKLGVQNRSQALLLVGTSGAWSGGLERTSDATGQGGHQTPARISHTSLDRLPAH
jgi:DNA-binding CsgD family transcriptional regulator